MACFCRCVVSSFTSEKVDYIFWKIKVDYQNSIPNYGITRRAAKKPVVVIYKVMYTEHYEIL